jgi:hypothetical protein
MDKKEKLEEQKKINQFKQFLVSFNSNNNINNDDYNINKKKEEEQETRDAKAFLQQRIPEVKREIKNEIDFHTKNMLNNIDKELSQIKNKK